MPSPTMLDLSRWQFAFTIIFHMTFPTITVGLAVFLAFVYGLYLRTHKAVYLQIFRFWKGIFGVGFALGVVAGAVVTFEVGLDWGPFANATGTVIAPIIGMEVVTAYFLEAGFIGVMLYGDGRVKERTIFISTCLVALGTLLSTTWIMSANSWMQTPSGFTIVNGQFEPTSWREVIVNSSVVWRYPHMLVAVLVSTAWLVGGIAAYYLIKGRVKEFARRTLSLSLGVLAVLLPLQLILGDHTAGYVDRYQQAKLEALEGNWTSTDAGYNVFAIPDLNQQQDKVVITVPKVGSYVAKNLSRNNPRPGLLLTPKADRPDVWDVSWGFRVMFYASLLMFAAALIGVVLRLRKRLYNARWFHKLLVWTTPIGVVAIIAGWVTAETGRQPFVVYSDLRASDAVSHLAPGSLVFSLAGFVCTYLALLTAWIVYAVRSVRRGPELDDGSE